MNRRTLLCLIVLLTVLASAPTLAQTTSFTYQGQLRQSGEPFTGIADLEFRLYDQLTSGNQIGSVQARGEWPVEDGLFQVELNFGTGAFDGNDRFLLRNESEGGPAATGIASITKTSVARSRP